MILNKVRIVEGVMLRVIHCQVMAQQHWPWRVRERRLGGGRGNCGPKNEGQTGSFCPNKAMLVEGVLGYPGQPVDMCLPLLVVLLLGF